MCCVHCSYVRGHPGQEKALYWPFQLGFISLGSSATFFLGCPLCEEEASSAVDGGQGWGCSSVGRWGRARSQVCWEQTGCMRRRAPAAEVLNAGGVAWAAEGVGGREGMSHVLDVEGRRLDPWGVCGVGRMAALGTEACVSWGGEAALCWH